MPEIQETISQHIPSLSQWLEKEQLHFPNRSSAIAKIIQAMATTATFIEQTIIHRVIDERGNSYTESMNASGDTQHPLDLLAQDSFVKSLETTQEVCAVISEESDALVPLPVKNAHYVVALDPLDGSSNVRVNAPIGTLFSIYARHSPVGTPVQASDVLVPGKQQLAAGYLLYSTVTMLVYATIYGVHGFTYDPGKKDFFLTHPALRMPENGITRQELSSRYTGALVADFHRHLLEGGMYLYPPTYKRPNGKLRLMFECNVLAFIAEQAGGLATDGKQPILQIMPRHIHQCVPLYIAYNLKYVTCRSAEDFLGLYAFGACFYAGLL
eukprot:gene144-193_t